MKVVLQIESSDTTYDTELAAAVVSADALIDSLLKAYDLTVPATVRARGQCPRCTVRDEDKTEKSYTVALFVANFSAACSHTDNRKPKV